VIAGKVYPLAPAAFETLLQVDAEIQATRHAAEQSAQLAQLAANRGRAFVSAIAATLGIEDGSEMRFDVEQKAIVVTAQP